MPMQDVNSNTEHFKNLIEEKAVKDDGSVFRDVKGVRCFYKPGDLVKPCTAIETLFAVAGSYKNQTTVQAIWLDSKNKITEADVRNTLVILSKQLSILQFCLSKQGMSIWFKRIKDFKVDLETSDKDVLEVFHEMLHTEFDLWNGPLWKVRFIHTPTKIPGKYSSALVFAVQHVITDGTTNMRMCRETTAILNEMSKANLIEPKLSPISPNINDFTDCSRSLNYLAKTFLKKINATLVHKFNRKSSFDGNLAMPIPKNGRTKVIYDDFSETETKNLIQMCRDANITVHTFIVTLTNFALMTVAQSKSPDCPMGPKTISATHCVNLRRYFDASHTDAIGCHMSWLENKNKMSLGDAKDFWGAAKRIHQSIKDEMEVKKSHLKAIPVLHYAGLIFPLNRFLTNHGYKNQTDCHYFTTNMGNLKDLLPGPKEGDDIEISYILRGVSSHWANNPFLLTFHTFRSKFMISLDYYTSKMSDEIAQEFFSILCEFIRKMTSIDQLNSGAAF